MAGRYSRSVRVVSVLALSLSLGACAGGGPFASAPPPAFDLTAPRLFPHAGRAARGQLMIAEPTGVSILDTEKVVVRTADGQISQLPGAQWSDRLPKLLQARILQAFENANRLRAVGRPGERLASDYQLLTDLRAFQISVGPETAAEVEIAVKVVADRSGRIVAAHVFRVVVPSAGIGADQAMAALDQAFGRAITQIVLWATQIV